MDSAGSNLKEAALEHCIIKRGDGIYADPLALGPTLQAAVTAVFADSYFSGLNYRVLIKALYDYGPEFAKSASGEPLVRFAAAIEPFDPARRQLYRAVKISDGKAEYYFEPVFLPNPAEPESPGVPALLEFDEFVADMWNKGIRFGIDEAAVRAAIAANKADRVIVARRAEAVPGRDAQIVEISDDLHRNDAPRQLANGKLDLNSFQNRFPQIKEGVRLLRKIPRAPGAPGFELSGIPLEPAVPQDVELAPLAGPGTTIQNMEDGEYLVSTMAGFLNIDTTNGQLSVDDKIISREGVSARTTGNLQLTGDFEEFGEVQEMRMVEGENITIHADVFGNVVSRGGTVALNHNLVGGSAVNARGDILVKGVASNAVVQAAQGAVKIGRAEGCTISGTRVEIEHAVNCEIMADELVIKTAEGCAVGARSVRIESAGPRRQSEMLVYALLPDNAKIDEVIGLLEQRVGEFEQMAAARQAEMDALTNEPDVRKYVMLASKIRKKELILTPEQVPQFQKMALAVGPQLKQIGKISLDVKAAQTECQSGRDLLAKLVEQKNSAAGASSVHLAMLTGEVVVRTLRFNPDGSSVYHLPPKDIKARLRSVSPGGERIFFGSSGSVEWSSAGAEA
ncbi:MAG: flagellar assembly protein A [Telluria sp.]